ncbi:MAG: O-antigen ligase family protein [Hyphomicrobiales bacterium]|nr:O-antigen ligase family protein [Hyphomicrobiales bacterium]
MAALAFAPLWFGSHGLAPWSVNALLFPGLTAAYEITLLARGRGHAFGLRLIAAPAALSLFALVWIGLQIAPAPGALAHPLWGEAARVLNLPLQGVVSIAPGMSVRAAMRLLTDASVFWLSLQLCRTPARAYRLMGAIAAIVVAISIFALLSLALWSAAIPFLDGPAPGGARGTFGNRNSFATYAGLGLVTLAALIGRAMENQTPERGVAFGYRLNRALSALASKAPLAATGFAIVVAALFGTGSRGGIVAAFAGLVAMALLVRRRRGHADRLSAVLTWGAAGVSLFLLGDLFFERIAQAGFGDPGRAAVYRIILRSIADAPLTGFGYGSFADAFRLYRDQSVSTEGVWEMAHNSYLEVLQGLGAPAGLALVLALLLLTLACARGALTRHRDRAPALAAFGAGALVATHALVDFSLEIEAVALTFMALLGAGVAQSRSSREATGD